MAIKVVASRTMMSPFGFWSMNSSAKKHIHFVFGVCVCVLFLLLFEYQIPNRVFLLGFIIHFSFSKLCLLCVVFIFANAILWQIYTMTEKCLYYPTHPFYSFALLLRPLLLHLHILFPLLLSTFSAIARCYNGLCVCV